MNNKEIWSKLSIVQRKSLLLDEFTNLSFRYFTDNFPEGKYEIKVRILDIISKINEIDNLLRK